MSEVTRLTTSEIGVPQATRNNSSCSHDEKCRQLVGLVDETVPLGLLT